jgi:hypothetical protein
MHAALQCQRNEAFEAFTDSTGTAGEAGRPAERNFAGRFCPESSSLRGKAFPGWGKQARGYGLKSGFPELRR